MGEYVNALKPCIDGVTWEEYEKLHVTLKFLGEGGESTAAQVSDILENLCLKNSPFNMRITRFGGFPGLDKPRVLYIGLSPNKELSTFQKDIDQELEALGLKMENRRFIPHITVGRVKKRFEVKKALATPERIDFHISEIELIKSELSSKGSMYTPLKVFDLAD